MKDWNPKLAGDLPNGLLLFDGICVFCNDWVNWVLARDDKRQFRFLPLQTEIGRAIAQKIGINPDAPETNAVILDGWVYYKSDAAIAVAKRVSRAGMSRALALLPRPLRDRLYDHVAKNRYRIHGRRDTCRMPTPEIRDRFILSPEDLR